MELHKCVLVKIYLPPTNQQNSKYYCYCGKHCYTTMVLQQMIHSGLFFL